MKTPSAAPSSRRMRNQLALITATALVLLAVAAFLGDVTLQGDASALDLRNEVVVLNETRQDMETLPDSSAKELADSALADAQEGLRQAAENRSGQARLALWLLFACSAAAVVAVALFCYVRIVRPFERLEGFASVLAEGNLDLPLMYEKGNPFGMFTWAFDNMRTELKHARAAEAAAIEHNKTAIAALSHDIKTPIASIRAYSEALELGLARNPEEQAAYARTIAKKCDEVTDLTNDLFLHAIAELDRISVECAPGEIGTVLAGAVADLNATGCLTLARCDNASVSFDPQRLTQIIENLVSNASKYAPESSIEISGIDDGGCYTIVVRDFGGGIAPEDLPFVRDRFYRGSNVHDQPGAGLGLSIVDYLATRMNASVRLENVQPGLSVCIEFPFEP